MQPEASLPVAVFVVGAGECGSAVLPLIPADVEVREFSRLDAECDVASHAPEVPDVVIIAPAQGSAPAESVPLARRRWPMATLVCIGVPTASEAVALLDGGADDVTMAGTPDEVVRSLIGASVRRARVGNEQLRVRFGDIVYDRESRRVWCAGREVAFTPRELRLFDILFQRAGTPVSVHTLQDFVWNEGGPTTSNSLAVYIGYLRRKLAGSRISMLETLRGNGYRLARRDD